ncbi:hypothetical protein N8940_02015 [Sphingomonadaceae bacterium]|nr:hypothetical protein [Sphingomonadaceae bacterium]
MTKRRSITVALAASAFGLAICAPLVPASAQGSALAMLNGLAKGQWEVRYRGGGATRKICVRTGRELIQLKHTETGCNRFVVEDGSSEVTVQYACAGNGYGRTNIRRETGSLVQIESQGIAGGLPFQFTAEARRTGSCS